MTGQNDLTQGSIWRQLVRYSIPLVISSVLQAMYGMVDMIVAGHYIGSVGLSAINNASSVMNMITNIIIGLATGGNVLIAQYFGAMDHENCRRSSVTLFCSGLISGAAVALLFFLFSRQILSLLRAPALEEATSYLRICSIGIFFIMGYNTTTAALRAIGNSRAPLICIASTCCLNIVLDLVFVGPAGMGVQGAALATTISQGVSFLISLVFVLRSPDLFGIRFGSLRIYRDRLRLILKLGLPCAVQMSVAAISWLSVTYIVNSYGVAVSAGNGVTAKLRDFATLFIVAMSNGSAGMIAQCIGAEDYVRARKVLYTAMRISVGMSLVIVAVMELFAPQFVSLFTTDPEAAAAAIRNLRIEILGQLFYAVFMLYHSLGVGSGHTWYVFFSSFVNCIVARVVLGFSFNALWGLDGLYWACMIAPFTSVPIGIWFDRSNRWKNTLIKE